ncbi:MAG TPA: hypothetical protein PKE40_05300 [Arachnia sp.]|nr:hypothetical protein [Arachnia sp.]HMT85751.1 hypothetical protein [Arachnia sp.]
MASVAVRVSRVLILELDSVRQELRFAAHGYPDPAGTRQAIAEITGMIRAALLVCDRIMLTDSMLLDGAYFAHMSPADVADALGLPVTDLPLTVVCAGESLSEALSRKQSEDSFESLKELGVDEPRKHRHWELWAAQEFHLQIEGYRDFPPLTPPDPSWRGRLSSEAKNLLAEIELLSRRKPVRGRAKAARRIHPGSAKELEEVYTWWETAYLVAIATALRADWLRFDAPQRRNDGYPRQARRGWKRIHVSSDLKDIATEITPAMFGIIHNQSRTARAKLQAKPSERRMRDLHYAITSTVQQASRPRALTSATVRILIAVAALWPATSALPPRLVWWGFFFTILATVPWDAVASVFAALRPQTTILSIQTEEDL